AARRAHDRDRYAFHHPLRRVDDLGAFTNRCIERGLRILHVHGKRAVGCLRSVGRADATAAFVGIDEEMIVAGRRRHGCRELPAAPLGAPRFRGSRGRTGKLRVRDPAIEAARGRVLQLLRHRSPSPLPMTSYPAECTAPRALPTPTWAWSLAG